MVLKTQTHNFLQLSKNKIISIINVPILFLFLKKVISDFIPFYKKSVSDFIPFLLKNTINCL